MIKNKNIMTKELVTGYDAVCTDYSSHVLEDPHIPYPRRQTIVRYVNILIDEWFKKILSTEKNKEALLLILRELIPERDIVDIFYDKRRRRKVNPFIDGHDAVFDVECIDNEGARFVVEMQRTEQEHFYDRALFYSTFPLQKQVMAESKHRQKATGEERTHDEQFMYMPVYLISFMNFSLHPGSDKVLYRYQL